MRIALSPCPNDTYLFHGWIEGLVGKDLPPEPVFADIQQLNEWALQKTFPLIKLSFNCFAQVIQNYQLLPVGSALGFHCGPKIIAKISFSVSELAEKTIAIPGQDTTAHLLLSKLLPPPQKKIFCLYHEIASLIENGKADCGLIIHESRFTFQRAGFVEIVDLGEMWHDLTGDPLPLGGVAITRETPDSVKSQIVAILRASLRCARQTPEKGLSFILQHSQEKDEGVVRQHIATYVNSETEQLSNRGLRAIETLLGCGPSNDWF